MSEWYICGKCLEPSLPALSRRLQALLAGDLPLYISYANVMLVRDESVLLFYYIFPGLIMNPDEIEYVAEEEQIAIIPKFNDIRIIHLISGDIGPFRAGIPVAVPLWVAVSLRQKEKCTIVAPEWLDIESLEAKLEEEKNSRLFTKMPSDHYMGIARLIFSVASRDIENSEKLKLLIKDLWDLRVTKARSSSDSFLKGGGRHAGIDFLTQLEICSLRPSLLDALDTTHWLTAPSENQHDVSSSFQSSGSSRISQ